VTFSVCWNKNRKTPAGEWESTPHWFKVLVWGRQREQALTFRKGDLVVLGGKLETNTWEKDGQKRTDVQIVADSVGLVPSTSEPSGESDW
jgi:single-strand DNA-binding protein